MDHDRWRAIIEASPLLVLVVDAEGTILDASRLLAPFSREEALGQSVYLFVVDEELAAMRARLAGVFATGVADSAEVRGADGRWFFVQSVPVQRDGKVAEVILLCQEATASKEKEDALARRERRFRALVEKSSDGFVLLSKEASLLYASPSTARLVGLESADTDPFTLVHPDDRAMARATFERSTQTTSPLHVRLRVVRGESVRLIECVIANLLDDPDVGGIVANFRDVTELESTRDERDRFFELSTDLVCVTGPDGFIRRLNGAAWERLLGWTEAELLARPYLELVHPEDVAASAAAQQKALAEPISSFENRFRCRDGSYRWIEWTSAFDEASGFIYAIARDITDKRRIDERVLHGQKMEAIGRLAGGVAHDINNMLMVIYSSTELLLAGMVESGEARSEILDIQHVAERSAALVRQLLAFGRKRPRSVREVLVDEAVAPLAKLIARCAGASIHVIARPDSRASVRIDPSELESIVMNLSLNARDAMPDGGTIEITTDVRPVTGARAVELGIDPGRYVALRVRDTGCGIPQELRHKVFEPFFTTKELGKGTGLGLATLFAIVQECSGAVEIDSEVGAGTTFTVLLPCVGRMSRSRPRLRAFSDAAR